MEALKKLAEREQVSQAKLNIGGLRNLLDSVLLQMLQTDWLRYSLSNS